MAGRKPKLTAEQVIDALKKSHGLKTGAAEILGVKFDTLQKYITRSKEAQELVEFWRIRRKDRAEYKLDEAIERGENWAIMFTLKNAADREYRDRVDVTSDGKVIEFVIKAASVPDGVPPETTGSE